MLLYSSLLFLYLIFCFNCCFDTGLNLPVGGTKNGFHENFKSFPLGGVTLDGCKDHLVNFSENLNSFVSSTELFEGGRDTLVIRKMSLVQSQLSSYKIFDI